VDEGFGARLRHQRERRQIALASIAANTKVSLSLLEGLERDDVSRWPTGIFRRAFVRAYAHGIGLDPDVVIREFLERHPDPPDVVPTIDAGDSAAGGDPTRTTPPTRLGCLVGSLTAALTRRRGARGMAVPLAGAATTPFDVALRGRRDARPGPGLGAAADLCARLARVHRCDEVPPLLEEATRVLDAVGAVVWSWDLTAGALNPTLAYGYSDAVLAQLANIRPDGEHAVAAAFRSREAQIVAGGDPATGAVVLPLLTATGCVGVLALELRNGGEQQESVRAFAAILGALLAVLIGAGRWVARPSVKSARANVATPLTAGTAVAL
jgi:hypothetical protein